MVHCTALTAAAVALLAALPVNAGLYSKSSPVIQLDGKSYDRLIAQSNYTSIVEFYAPWCGHCKNLQPAYEKAAKKLAGLAKVAAIDCDEDANKPFCGGMGVQGFPTLKIVKPGKNGGKPIVEDYQGPRTAAGIVDAVAAKIPNHVTKVQDKNLEGWLTKANETAKAILFTDKTPVSSLMRAIAIEFKGGIEMAQIGDKEKASMELFGITKIPTLILLPGGKEAEGIVYDGELKKNPIVKFLSQASAPNPDPAPPKAKASKSKSKDSKKDTKAKESFEKSSASQASEEKSSAAASATEEVVEEPTDSPSPEVESEKPAVLPAPPISMLPTEAELEKECLGPRTGTCVLALLPMEPNELALKTVQSLSEVAHKYRKTGRKNFPIYALSPVNPGQKRIEKSLSLAGGLEVIAINGRRGWWRQLPKAGETITATDISEDLVENWIEMIRLGDGAKQKIPEGLIPEEVEEPVVEDEPIKTEEQPAKEAEEPVVKETEEEPVKETHDEL